MVLRQNSDANVPRCNADGEGENDRSLITSDTKTRPLNPGTRCQIKFRLIQILSLVSFVFFALILFVAQAIGQTTPPNGAVLTWHNDNFRTGWQQQETILTTSTVPKKLRISQRVKLMDQVDAQPLVIPSFINGHDIAFVADESNNVYQIDANTGAILTQVTLGAPVFTPLNCSNNGPQVGVNSTPVIDWASQTLFVIAYVNVSGTTPTYFLHALDLHTLKDKASPLQIAASHTLTNGDTFTFDARNQRQRAALLFANGNVYAAFGSFCDFNAGSSRGWLLGWNFNGTTLSALPANQLNDTQSSSPTNFLLSSIWMSGAGPASDESGNLIFSTGNSDGPNAASSTWTDTTPCSGTGAPCSNIQESVVKLNGNLTGITGLFSPNATFGVFSPDTLYLDQQDLDLGSGGVLLVPQRNSASLAAVAGKDGRLFLFDRAAAGSNGLNFLQLSQGSACWCAPSYFTGSDGVSRIVTSQGGSVQTFQVQSTSLSLEGTSGISSGQDGGFFTMVSCNGSGAFGNCANTPIIWAVSRPLSGTSTGVNLYAFSGLAVNGSYPQLFGPTQVGSWPNIGGNSNIVPTVANGMVYVASNKLLTILNIKAGGKPAAATPLAAAETAAPLTSAFAISGTLGAVYGSTLTLTNRNGKYRLVDASKAIADGHIAAALTTGKAYTAVGSSFTSAGALLADAIYRAKCRQQNDAGANQAGVHPACTGDQWPPDVDPGQQLSSG